jgi:hypothetical protein
MPNAMTPIERLMPRQQKPFHNSVQMDEMLELTRKSSKAEGVKEQKEAS